MTVLGDGAGIHYNADQLDMRQLENLKDRAFTTMLMSHTEGVAKELSFFVNKCFVCSAEQ